MIFIILFQQQQPPNLRPLRVEDELCIAEELQVEEELRVVVFSEWTKCGC